MDERQRAANVHAGEEWVFDSETSQGYRSSRAHSFDA
jgi:hypothetical protein